MEQQNQSQDSSLFSLDIDATILNYLSEIIRWGRFLAIVGFVLCGVIFLAGIIISFVVNNLGNYYQGNLLGNLGIGFLIFFYIILAVIYFFPCLYLLRFCNAVKLALASNDQIQFTEGFKNLKTLFKYVGIITIVIISFYLLFFLFSLFRNL
jgi:hypothetical protein